MPISQIKGLGEIPIGHGIVEDGSKTTNRGLDLEDRGLAMALTSKDRWPWPWRDGGLYPSHSAVPVLFSVW